ncbi:TRAP transporter large permease [Clostridium sp. AM58-1XD]|uniref:TRAP transporter large permease n=1 Tax=Clostridium sp. AM58-1XD TaxID=2292307 RepID=UPI001FA8F8CF|nr:TRAP transporter large permease [Clostridium sp. AM58-1XD]
MDGVSFISFLPLIIAVVLFFLKVPIGFSLLASSLFYFGFINTTMPVDLALQNLITGLESFPMLAIPFFIMVGVVMNYAGISTRLMNFADLCVGHLPGSLGHVNVLLSTLMGGISGSSNADCAMQCKILVPEMEKRGYRREFSAAVTANSSLIPSVIPPGIVLIIYCMVARVSIGKLFMAGYIPGIMLCVAMMIVVHIEAKKQGYGKSREKRATVKEIAVGLKDAVLALFMPLGLIMGLRFGLFTATEGGAVSVIYCFIVGIFVYKEIKVKDILPILKETFYSTAVVIFIIIGANLFGYYLTWERIPNAVSTLILGLTQNKFLFLLGINIFLLICGMFIEAAPIIIVLMPLLMEPLAAMNINLIHFGIVMVLNLQLGGLTPPFGSMMFIACSMLKIPMTKFVKASIPFYAASLIVLMLITYFPQIVMFIPNLLM